MSTTAAPTASYGQLHANISPSVTVVGGLLVSDPMSSLPALKPDLLLNDTGLFTVYHFIKNFIG